MNKTAIAKVKLCLASLMTRDAQTWFSRVIFSPILFFKVHKPKNFAGRWDWLYQTYILIINNVWKTIVLHRCQDWQWVNVYIMNIKFLHHYVKENMCHTSSLCLVIRAYIFMFWRVTYFIKLDHLITVARIQSSKKLWWLRARKAGDGLNALTNSPYQLRDLL